MRIITLTCPDCDTVVSANELEQQRVMNCANYECDAVLRFSDLSESDREHFLEHKERYEL
ncbi:MAG: hypothetical protein ABEJ82_06965 [Haloplanus sp.]